jgi:dTDP-4-amino-4,6-dideoxygalactose transaminase
MMVKIPFLKPSLPKAAAYLPRLQEMDANGHYSNFGPLNQRFEQQLLSTLFDGQGHLTTVSNCTLGLMLAINALKRAGARYAVMPSFTFAATPLAAQWCGLEPYFVDIEPGGWAMATDALAAAIDELGDQVAVVVPYATFGQPIDLAAYQQWVDRGIPVVVDAAPGLGACTPDGTPFGAGFGGAVVFSCHATKPFGIGEGGVVYSADRALIARIRSGSNFGFDEQRHSVALGMNAKLPEALAAVGMAVIDGYPAKLGRLELLHTAYLEALERLGLMAGGWAMQGSAGRVPRQFLPLLAPLTVAPEPLMQELSRRHGIETRAYFRPPCHAQPQFAACGRGILRVTEAVAGRVICLPLWDGMDVSAVTTIVSSLAESTRWLVRGEGT